MNKTDLKLLEDGELLVRLSKLVNQSRRVESVFVAHIAEVDARRLYASQASPSMYQYCIDALHLSEAEAYLRIEAARASRRHPLVLTMLEDGRLHLSGIGVLAPQLKKLNRADGEALLARAIHKTKRQIKVLVAGLAPKPDVPPSIRKVPEKRMEAPRKDASGAASENHPSSEEATTSGRSHPEPSNKPAPESPDPRAKVEPLSASRYIVQFTASAELCDKLERLAALMPGSDLASRIDTAVSEKVERLEAKRFAKTNKPRKSLEDADTSPGVRGISAPVRRFVWERDGGQCTYVSREGKRCPARESLEYHHDDPYGLGGDRSATNIRLMCTCHNLYMAEMDYGKETMDQYRRSADSVCEPAPSFELRPDGAPYSPSL